MQPYRLHELTHKRHRTRVVTGLVLVVLLLVAALNWHNQHYNLLSVQSASMMPLIEPGDAVLLRKVPASDLRTGDVVSYRDPSGEPITITHRIVAINGTRIVTQGDENMVPDVPVDASQVIGRAESKFQNAGYVIDFMRSRLGLVLFVYIPAIILVAIEMRRLAVHFQPPYRHTSTYRHG